MIISFECFKGFPGLASPYQQASFHSLLAGLSSQHRPKLGEMSNEYQSLLAAAAVSNNGNANASPKTSPASPTAAAFESSTTTTPSPTQPNSQQNEGKERPKDLERNETD
jgi:hypothetical protein